MVKGARSPRMATCSLTSPSVVSSPSGAGSSKSGAPCTTVPKTCHPRPARRLVTSASESRGPPVWVSHCFMKGVKSRPALREKARVKSLQEADRYMWSRQISRNAPKKARSPIRLRTMWKTMAPLP